MDYIRRINEIFALFLFFTSILCQQRRTCRLEDFHYEYTECDSSGGRWRVPVPKVPRLCTPASSPGAPVRGKDCNFACSRGEYLDIQGDQECHACPAGTYSLGGGLRFDDWQELPSGFAVKTEHVHNSWMSRKSGHLNCSRAEWTPRGGYIMSVPSQCPSSLLFSAKLVRPGKVTFEYQYTDPDALFHFTVQNEQCQAFDKDKNDKWPKVTSKGKWSSVVIELKSGMTVLQWRTLGALSSLDPGVTSPILIRKIEITGVAYTSQCSSCPNGTYSSGGSSLCQLCSSNTFAGHGATQCQPCSKDTYSEPGASHCLSKPPCSKEDFVQYQKPCNDEGKTQLSYKWIEPKVCSDTVEGSVALSPDGDSEDCPPCNTGMYQVNASTCDFCQPNEYVDYNSKCRACPMSTAPMYNLDYTKWNVLPPNVSTHCIALGVQQCSDSAGWVAVGDYVKTVFGKQDEQVFLVLTLKMPGFKGEPSVIDGKPIPLAEVTFEIEMNCHGPCQLLFLSDSSGRNTVLESWEESFTKMRFTHEIFTNESFDVTWAFQPDDFSGLNEATDYDYLSNYVKMYSIKVTNTISGGAIKCETCPEGKTDTGCVPCPDGYYIDSLTQKCSACPQGTVLPSKNAWGRESCKPCGQGLHPVEAKACRSDCHFTDDAGRTYDFTPLDGIHFVAGARLFMASGIQYYHGFNFSLCNHKDEELPTCVNNVTTEALHQEESGQELIALRTKLLNQPGRLSAMVCRSTLVPDGGPDLPVMSTQPVSLGTHLTKIKSNISMAALYEKEGFPSEETERDIHFYYESGGQTSACPKGRISIISLQCDPKEDGKGKIQLPPKCADGTCDGCLFHFLWLSRLACPKCRKEDYSVVKGECVSGEQEIHYFPPQHCLQLPTSELTPTKQTCKILPFVVMISIPIAIGVGLILVILLIYCWSRNKNLEYKYSKLVETAGGRDGEMPAADTCGMEDDEDDVHYAGDKSTSFFGRLKNKLIGGGNVHDDDNPFVAVKMSESMSLT